MATDDTTGTTDVVVPLEDGTEAAIDVPTTASRSECAALAAAIGAHLSDRRRQAAAADDGEPETADRWKLAGRLRAARSSRLPRHVRRGEEWKAAGRTRP